MLSKARAAGLFSLLVILLAAGIALDGAEWSRFRGPNGSGVAESANLPAEFGPERNVVWKTALPPGHSSPVLSDRHVFLTAAEGEELLTICLDRSSGKILWKRAAPRARAQPVDKRNHPASPSPATDGQHVYVFFQDFGLISYSPSGDERWTIPLGPFTNSYGMGSSPVVVDDKVVLVLDQNAGSFVVAVGKDDGKVRWKTERPEAKTGHSTPIVRRPATGPAELLIPGSFYLTAYSVQTGEKIWWVSGLAFEMKATPVLGTDTVFIHGTSTSQFKDSHQNKVPDFETVQPTHDLDGDQRFAQAETPDELAKRWFRLLDMNHDGFLDKGEWQFYQAARKTRGGMWAFRPGGRGDVTDQNVLWHYDRAVPQLPSPLLYRDTLYMVNDGGIVTSLDPRTGKAVTQKRLEGAMDNFYASPIAADGKIFLASESGKIAVLKAGPELEVMAVNDLGDLCYATPAIEGGRIYVRTRGTLYAFGQAESTRSGQ
jgi:outer membrane protein assembly factor BamB